MDDSVNKKTANLLGEEGEEFEERAAIRQYDGRVSREEAERLAAEEIISNRKPK